MATRQFVNQIFCRAPAQALLHPASLGREDQSAYKDVSMLDQFINSLTFVGIGLGIVGVFCALELLLRSLTNRYATPQLER